MHRSVRIFWRFILIGFGSFLLLLLMANFGLLGKMPSIEDLENPSASLASEVIAEDGTVMGKYYLQDRTNVEYKDISQHVIKALIATEDERFYDHSGIDSKAMARAVFFLGSKGGASTITMQTAKNLFTENWGTRNILLRGIQKIKECIIAVKLERNFTKEEILALYLNTVEFSDNIFGVRNAAKTFFQKEPDVISKEEAAMLVGMVNAPGMYNPRRFPKPALDRRNLVIDQMVRNNYMTEGEAKSLKVKPIVLNYKKLDQNAGLAPYFRMVLGEEMKKWCNEHRKSNGEKYNLYRDGLKIYTTINPRMQLYAEEAVAKHINYMQKILNSQSNIKTGKVWADYQNVLNAAMKKSDRWKNGENEGLDADEIKKSFQVKVPMKIFAWNKNREVDTVMTPMDSIKYSRQMLQAGFMVMDPLSGNIKAWVGGIDFKTFKYDHVNQNTKRQVGSTMKPLLYSMAVEDASFTPTTPVVDVQQNFGSFGMVPNTGASCTGRSMQMAQALAQSRNCATAYILKQLGPGNEGAKQFVEFLKKCNIKTEVPAYPSIALGSSEISLYEMMWSYSMFPGRGFSSKPMLISRIEDHNGNVLESFVPQRSEVISEVTAYTMARMMQGTMQFGTGRRIWGYGVTGEIAGKTGTTNDNSDAWFMGYTPQMLGGVWVGCDDRFIRFNSTDVGQGSSAALPIWAYFYEKAANDKNCNLDMGSKFLKPEIMSNDINYDWMNNLPPQLGAEGENQGTATSGDYLEEIPDLNPEDIGPESELPKDPKSTPPVKKDSKPTDSKQPAAKPDNKEPKAVMPKKQNK